jgi:hypothetical protein
MKALLPLCLVLSASVAWSSNDQFPLRDLGPDKRMCLCRFDLLVGDHAWGFLFGLAGAAIDAKNAAKNQPYGQELATDYFRIHEDTIREAGAFELFPAQSLVRVKDGKGLSLAEAAKENDLFACVGATLGHRATVGWNKKLVLQAQWTIVGPSGSQLKFTTEAQTDEAHGKFPDAFDPKMRPFLPPLARKSAEQFLEKLGEMMRKAGSQTRIRAPSSDEPHPKAVATAKPATSHGTPLPSPPSSALPSLSVRSAEQTALQAETAAIPGELAPVASPNAAVSPNPDTQATANAMDCSHLAPRITKAYTVPEVSNKTAHLTPKKGYQLIVVELRGIAKTAMSIALQSTDFTATTTDDTTVASAVGLEKKEMYAEVGVETNDAVGKDWAISGTTADGTSLASNLAWNKRKPGSFSMAVCFSLIEHITQFELACGTYTVGPVTTLPPTHEPAPTARAPISDAPAVPVSPMSPPAAPEASASLQVRVRPWAQVSVDDDIVGTTPFAPLTLSPGPHYLAFVHPDFKPVRRKVTLSAGETLKVELDMTLDAVPK